MKTNQTESLPVAAQPTPRTDAMCECYCGPLCWIGDQQFIPASFAGELERELASANECLRQASMDARLIAACPELLAALESVERNLSSALSFVSDRTPEGNAVRRAIEKIGKQARAAIAKAKGEA